MTEEAPAQVAVGTRCTRAIRSIVFCSICSISPGRQHKQVPLILDKILRIVRTRYIYRQTNNLDPVKTQEPWNRKPRNLPPCKRVECDTVLFVANFTRHVHFHNYRPCHSTCGRVGRVCGARHPSILSLHPTKHQKPHISNQGGDEITCAGFFFFFFSTHLAHPPQPLCLRLSCQLLPLCP